jgi:hypothetical protein
MPSICRVEHKTHNGRLDDWPLQGGAVVTAVLTGTSRSTAELEPVLVVAVAYQ